MDVRVVSSLPTSDRPETDYVRVRMFCAPDDDTVTLATIERVVDKANGESPDHAPTSKKIKKLVTGQPMTADEALEFATSYAERKGIPVVFDDRDEKLATERQ
jgi:hypothetical protein